MRRLALCSVLVLLVCSSVSCRDPEPQFTAPMTLGGREVPAEVLERGARIYQMRCASCHGSDGSGKGPAGGSLRVKPRDFEEAQFRHKSTPGDALPTDEDLARVIREGLVEQGMPAWPGLSAEDLDALIQYLKTFSPRWKTEVPPQEGGA